MSSTNKDALTDHSYDGIQEYDNPTPGWWTWLFIATIVAAIPYFFFVNVVGQGELGATAFYARDKVAESMKHLGKYASLQPDAPTLVKYTKDAEALSMGESIFKTNCVSCHGREGEGVSAPNLTDDVYLNVKVVSDIPDVVKNGRKEGAMPAWNNRLQPAEIFLVSSYVASIRGKNLPSTRAKEGQQIAAWSEK